MQDPMQAETKRLTTMWRAQIACRLSLLAETHLSNRVGGRRLIHLPTSQSSSKRDFTSMLSRNRTLFLDSYGSYHSPYGKNPRAQCGNMLGSLFASSFIYFVALHCLPLKCLYLHIAHFTSLPLMQSIVYFIAEGLNFPK